MQRQPRDVFRHRERVTVDVTVQGVWAVAVVKVSGEPTQDSIHRVHDVKVQSLSRITSQILEE